MGNPLIQIVRSAFHRSSLTDRSGPNLGIRYNYTDAQVGVAGRRDYALQSDQED